MPPSLTRRETPYCVLKKGPRLERNVRPLIRAIPRFALLLGPQSADGSVMDSKRPGDIR